MRLTKPPESAPGAEIRTARRVGRRTRYVGYPWQVDTFPDSVNPQQVSEFLGRHPLVGMTASVGGTAVTFVESVEPFLRAAGLVVGLAIGVVTLIIKFKQLRHETKTPLDQ